MAADWQDLSVKIEPFASSHAAEYSDTPIPYSLVDKTDKNPDEETDLPTDPKIDAGVVPPHMIDPPCGSMPEAAGPNDGKEGSQHDAQPKPTRPKEEIRQPAVQQSPPIEFIRGSVGTVPAMESRNLTEVNNLGLERIPGLGAHGIAPHALHDSSHSIYDRPGLSIEMQRFSSIDMAFAVIPETSLETAWAGNFSPLRSSSSEKVTSSGSQRYFVSRPQGQGDIAMLRDSYSDSSVQHVADSGEALVFDEISGEIQSELPLEGRLASGEIPTHASILTSASILVNHKFDLEAAKKNEEKASSANSALSASVHDAAEPEQGPPKYRSLRRFLGLLMAGVFITLQETSRILRNQNDEEKSLHLL
ncbi:MAG: hypothetical protein NTY15_17395 [Planctomycetota bacterium]|nr:hypothetical protein [Planctomycetota bacterium]